MRKLAVFLICCGAAFAQAPTIASVVNTESYTTTLCSGGLATIYGTNFGTSAAAASVMVGQQAGYIVTISPTQMNVQIPFGLSTGSQPLSVTIGGASSGAFPITLSAAAPAVGTATGAGTGLGSFFAESGAYISYANPATPGQTLTTAAVGLGPTTPATPTGLATVANPVTTLPTITVGGVSANAFYAGVYPGFAGVYQVNFTLPSGVQGTVPFVISSGGQSSPSAVTIPLAGTSSVVNNASFAHPGTVAPGSIASVFANGLGSATTLESSGVFPSTSSEGLQVTFNGTAAPLFHVIPATAPTTNNPEGSSGQIDLLVPDTLPTTGTVNVQLTTSSADYQNYTLNMVPASPGFFRFTDPKTSNAYAIAQFTNSAWVVLPVAATADIGLPACTAATSALTECGEPANIGDYLTIYMTGLGLVTAGGTASGAILPLGQNPPINGSTLYETPTMPTVTIGGVTATPLFSGLAPGYAGEYQIDVQIPPGVASGDSVPVVVTMMGQSDTANISVQPTRVPPLNQ